MAIYKHILCLLFVSIAYCKDCADSVECAEKSLVGLLDQFDAKESVEVFGEVMKIEKVGDVVRPKSEEGFIERMLRYLQNHELRIRMPTSAQESVRGLVTGKRLTEIVLLLLKLMSN